MGWASGTEVFHDVWGSIRQYIKPKDRPQAVLALIEALQSSDWDCVNECQDGEFPEETDAGYALWCKKYHPDQEEQ